MESKSKNEFVSRRAVGLTQEALQRWINESLHKCFGVENSGNKLSRALRTCVDSPSLIRFTRPKFRDDWMVSSAMTAAARMPLFKKLCKKRPAMLEHLQSEELRTLLSDKEQLSIHFVKCLRETQAVHVSQPHSHSLCMAAECQIIDIRPLLDGRVVLTSLHHFKEQLTAGFYQCELCGMFCSQYMGLRNHIQSTHETTFLEARSRANNFVEVWNIAAETKKAPPITRNRDSLPLICHAARYGDMDMLQSIIASDEDAVHTTDLLGSTALMWGAGSGHLELCRFLVERKADVLCAQQKDKRSALHFAARNGHVSVLKYLLEDCAVPVDIMTVDGSTAFHWAAWQGHIETCKYLSAYGANVHHANHHGCNAVLWATTRKNNVAMCSFLTDELGVSETRINKNGHSALHKSAVLGEVDVCKWVVKKMEQNSNRRMWQEDDEGHTPLDLARLNGQDETYEFLQPAQEYYESRVLFLAHGNNTPNFV